MLWIEFKNYNEPIRSPEFLHHFKSRQTGFCKKSKRLLHDLLHADMIRLYFTIYKITRKAQ